MKDAAAGSARDEGARLLVLPAKTAQGRTRRPRSGRPAGRPSPPGGGASSAGLEAVDLASAARRLVDCRRSWPEPDSLRLRRLLVLVESCEAMARRLAKAGPLQSERAARDARALLRLVTLFLQDHRPGSGQPKLD